MAPLCSQVRMGERLGLPVLGAIGSRVTHNLSHHSVVHQPHAIV